MGCQRRRQLAKKQMPGKPRKRDKICIKKSCLPEAYITLSNAFGKASPLGRLLSRMNIAYFQMGAPILFSILPQGKSTPFGLVQ
jgi:hypothetical protein